VALAQVFSYLLDSGGLCHFHEFFRFFGGLKNCNSLIINKSILEIFICSA
jgi:hypothetical protein